MVLEIAVQLDSDPPEMEISDSMKLVDASEREKVRVAVSPAFNEETSELMEMVGDVVSFAEVSEACVAVLPAKSLTSAEMVRLPSSSVERSTDETE